MKKLTRNDVYELAGTRAIIKVGYCRLQSLLKHFECVGYNSGVYGWNYDVYDCKDCVIVTGYRMMIKGIDVNVSYAKYADERSRQHDINNDWNENWTPRDFIFGLKTSSIM